MSTPSVANMLAELLIDHATIDGTKWKPLRPRHDGAKNIWLAGQEVWWATGPFSPNSQNLTETWPTNSTDISTGQDHVWSELAGDVEVSGNLLRTVGTSVVCDVRCSDVLDTDNHRHTATATLANTSSPNFEQAETWCRVGTAASDPDRYTSIALRRTGGSSHWRRLQKRVSGSATTLASSDGTDPGSPITLYCEANGSAIAGGIGAYLPTATDTAITGNVRVGLRMYTTTAAGNATLDTHNFYDLAVATSFLHYYQHYYRTMVAA